MSDQTSTLIDSRAVLVVLFTQPGSNIHIDVKASVVLTAEPGSQPVY